MSKSIEETLSEVNQLLTAAIPEMFHEHLNANDGNEGNHRRNEMDLSLDEWIKKSGMGSRHYQLTIDMTESFLSEDIKTMILEKMEPILDKMRPVLMKWHQCYPHDTQIHSLSMELQQMIDRLTQLSIQLDHSILEQEAWDEIDII